MWRKRREAPRRFNRQPWKVLHERKALYGMTGMRWKWRGGGNGHGPQYGGSRKRLPRLPGGDPGASIAVVIRAGALIAPTFSSTSCPTLLLTKIANSPRRL